MIFFVKLNAAGRNDIHHANISGAPILDNNIHNIDAPILNAEMLRREKATMLRRERWKKSKGIRKTALFNRTKYDHDKDDNAIGIVRRPRRPRRVRRNKKMKNTSYEQADVNDKRTQPSRYHPIVTCLLPDGCNDFISEGIDLLPSLSSKSKDSIPVLKSLLSNTQSTDLDGMLQENSFHEDGDDDSDNDTANNGNSETCRETRSFESRTTTHPTCNDIHSLGFDDQMFFDEDYSSRGESIDLLAVGGANSVWKTTSNHNGENAILKTAKYVKFYDSDRLSLYVLDAMVASTEGNPQLFTLLQSEKAVAKVASTTTTSASSLSSSWNHIMPLYSHCHTATIAPVASGTLNDYVSNYPDGHNGETIDPLDKLRLALQVARGLHQIQMYRFGMPTFAHLDLNPSQFLVFHPQHHHQSRSSSDIQHNGNSSNSNNNIPILQINDFNRGRFLLWDKQNNTCPFQFDGCDKNTRGSRWHAPDRFIGCIDVNEKVDTFTLGGIFFFLLSDGEAPFSETRSFDHRIKDGEMPPLPISVAAANSGHPAFEALSEMVVRCRAFEKEDRPTSLEVVRMLEDKLRKIELLGSRQ